MPLDQATRERLRAAALKNKGRSNLMGLDQTLGLVALDNVQDRDGELPKWTLRADGHLRHAQGGTFAFDVRCHYDEVAKRGKYQINCPWVRVSYAPDWLKEQFAARWDKRTITYHAMGQPKHAPVFPVAPVMEFFKFVWPASEDLEDRVRKYLNGYAESWIQKRPGPGAVMRAGADEIEMLRGRIGTVSQTVGPFVYINMDDDAAPVTTHRAGGKWTVIG